MQPEANKEQAENKTKRASSGDQSVTILDPHPKKQKG